MATNEKQSALDEVRDQLSLDYADGKYLNIVASNLGLSRPRIGITDDTWRAVVKAIALSFKQIKTKFEEVLAVFFGPRVTVSTTLTVNASIGDKILYVTTHEDFPQLGTVVLDEGLATEETVEYCYINRTTNQMFLNTALVNNHEANIKNTDQSLIGVDAVTGDRIVVPNVEAFPSPGAVGSYTIVIGAGTDAEESAVVVGRDTTNRVLTLQNPLTNTHNSVAPSAIRTDLARTINPVHPTSGLIQNQGVTTIRASSTARFPPTGILLLGPAGPGAAPTNDVFTATSGSTTTVSAAASTFVAGAYSGFRIKFANDTTTAALRGLEAVIITNTDSLITLGRTLPAAVATGDTYRIRPVVEYTSVDYEENLFALRRAIPGLSLEHEGVELSDTVAIGSTTQVIQLTTGGLTVNAYRGRTVLIGGQSTQIVSNTASTITVLPLLPSTPLVGSSVLVVFNTTIELLEPVVKWNATGEAVETAQVKSTGTGWDVIQTSINCVEILTPASIRDISDIRSASYLHEVHLNPTPTTTLASAVSANDLEFTLTNPIGFPFAGVVQVGGENVTYYTVQTHLTTEIGVGATTLVVHNSSNFPDTGNIILDPGGANQETVTISANNRVTNTLTVSATANEHLDMVRVQDSRFFIPHTGFVSAHGGGTAATLYQPELSAGTGLLDGNLWLFEDVFPGPYLYKPDELTAGGYLIQVRRTAPAFGVASTENTKTLAGPVRLELEQRVGATALEVVDASAFELTSFPYDLRAGLGTGNLETVQVQDVNLRQRASTTVQTGSIVGDTTLEVVETQGVGVADSFPSARGYRILIDKGTPEEEVAYVQAVTTQVSPLPDIFILESPLVFAHNVGSSVELMSDVLTVTATTDDHAGVISYANRSTAVAGIRARWPEISSTQRLAAEIVAPTVDSILINDPTGFPVSGGSVYLNFGRVAGGVDDYNPYVYESRTTSALFPGSVLIPVADVSGYPQPLFGDPFVVTLDPGGLREERLRITNIIGSQLQSETPLRFSHTADVLVQHTTSKEELLTYTSVVGNNLRFSPPIVLQFTHSPRESAVLSLVDSLPSLDGYDFPFYLPPNLSFRLQRILDLVRAAGVCVTFIDQR